MYSDVDSKFHFFFCEKETDIRINVTMIFKQNLKSGWIYLLLLESGIEVTPWINLASGKFDKKNKLSFLELT